MRALVVVASKHGANEQIAETIAAVLTERGVATDVALPEGVTTLAGYDVVILGGAIYADRWMSQMHAFADRFPAALKDRIVYIFASGPVGTDETEWQMPADIEQRAVDLGAREVRLFAGRVDATQLGAVERAVLRMAGTQEGDFRDQQAISAWASHVADEVLSRS